MEHKCIQDERIRDLSDRLGRVETKVDNVQKVLDKLLWGIFGTLGTSFLTLVTIILKSAGNGGCFYE